MLQRRGNVALSKWLDTCVPKGAAAQGGPDVGGAGAAALEGARASLRATRLVAARAPTHHWWHPALWIARNTRAHTYPVPAAVPGAPAPQAYS